VFVGSLTLDLLLGDVRSLKQKRAVIKPIIADLDRRGAIGAAEVDHQNLYRRTAIGVVAVAGTHARVTEMLRDCEGAVAWRPEVDLLSARTRVRNDEDD
jgi:hypothetical protein